MKFAVCLVLLALGSATAEKVSPVQKVIELLDQLKGKVEADLAAEATAMEEYSSWCDTEISDKGYAIKTATREIADHNAAISDAEATISAKTAEIGELGSTIAAKGGELADAGKVYAGEKKSFEESEKELVGTVDELAGGIIQVKKGASFVQVKKSLKPVADVLAKIIEASGVEGARKRALGAFLQSHENDDLSLNAPQANVEDYSSHSGGIVETLEDMKAKAEDQLSTARKGAMESKYNYDMVKMSLEQEIKNLKAQLASATAAKAATTEALGKAKGDLAGVQNSKAADEEYLSATKMQCESTASAWALRQKDAAGETAAIEKAKEILASGVKAFIQTSVKARTVDEDDMVAARRERLAAALNKLGGKFHSFALAQLAHRATVDPFAKIKAMINEMVEKLLQEANEEASHKAFCDEELSKSRASQAEKSSKLDKYSARADTATTTIAELEEAIKGLQAEVAEIDAGQGEAAKIRTEEHEDYLKASKDFKDSAEAVAAATQVLKSYYEGGSFIQVAAKTASKSKQPSFGGASSDVGGTIISVLEVAESDFTKLLAEADTDEESAAAAFAKLSDENKVTKATKETEVKGKQSEIRSLSVNLQNYNEDKASVGEELDAVLSYLDKLKPECEVTAMSYEEKVARREAEIAGLKEALGILEGQDIPALLQVKAHLRR
jgi:hypothetical protein